MDYHFKLSEVNTDLRTPFEYFTGAILYTAGFLFESTDLSRSLQKLTQSTANIYIYIYISIHVSL